MIYGFYIWSLFGTLRPLKNFCSMNRLQKCFFLFLLAEFMKNKSKIIFKRMWLWCYRINGLRLTDLCPNWNLLLVTEGDAHLVEHHFMPLLDPNPDAAEYKQRPLTELWQTGYSCRKCGKQDTIKCTSQQRGTTSEVKLWSVPPDFVIVCKSNFHRLQQPDSPAGI